MNKEQIPKKKVMMPIGIDNFHDLITHQNEERTSYLFVDKSLFIKEFIHSGDKITLITRPRRFGKTLTLSMLQHFLAAEVSGQRTEGLFDGLKVTQHPETMRYQGQHPVIFLTLKGVKGRRFQQAFEQIKEVITDLFETHGYLLKSDKVSETQKTKFNLYINQEVTQAQYARAIQFLSKLLHQHTGKKVYVLLDEYDSPINDAYVNDYYEDCRSFFATMFGVTFKGNDALERGLITGILKIAKASLFSELNNLEVYTMLNDDRYFHYFGFTELETDNLLDRAGLPQKAHELKSMYNGYQIKKHTLYNPFSIVAFVSHALLLDDEDIQEALRPYWVNTGGTHLIGNIIKYNLSDLEEGLNLLVQGKPITTFINEEVIFNPNLRHNPIAFWSILLLSGYLKVVAKEAKTHGHYIYKLLFPNEEIKQAIENLLLDVVAGGTHKKLDYLLAMQSLVDGDIKAFTRFLKAYIRHVPSYFDTGENNKELFFHGLIIGMVTALWEHYHITSNRESGDGRYDIALEPHDKKKKGILIELKIGDQDKDLTQEAQKALSQINDMHYKTDLQARGISNFLMLGIAFRGKEVEVSPSII